MQYILPTESETSTAVPPHTHSPVEHLVYVHLPFLLLVSSPPSLPLVSYQEATWREGGREERD